MTSSQSYPPPFEQPPFEQPYGEPPEPRHPLHRFRRSSRDRKIGGVAGGIGRALGVDPVLIRIAFVVLTIFGGAGVGIYALGWLLLPGDHDQASAGEALIGRGRSSVPAPLAVVLCLVVLGSFTSTFTWGRHLLPIAIVAAIVFFVVGRRRRRSWRFHDSDKFGEHLQHFADRAGRWGDDVGRKAERWGDDVGRKAERWADDFGRRAERWGNDLGRRMGGDRARPADSGAGRTGAADAGADRTGSGSRGSSPFEAPAFWDDAARSAGPVDLAKPGPTAPGPTAPAPTAPAPTSVDPTLVDPTSVDPTSVDPDRAASDSGRPYRPSAPAWDPLGAAPFAWDLPEPGPVPPSPQELARNRRAKALGRATFGVALIVAATMALGVSVHWWDVSWAAISASALAVVAVGVFVSAVRGRRSNLIGVGILLSLATAFFTVTGFSGTGGFGDRTWTPTTVAEIEAANGSFSLAAGDATLDLTNVDVPKGETVTIDADLNMGDLTVILPNDANVQATCTGNVGSMSCLGEQRDGASNESHRNETGNQNAGTFELTAHVGAGNLEVRRG
ncbi:PspC domain-containing protein [Nakamurella lactea]|uniref:PspC domain-containing protein n=1 Tax=Nakamurella lactea TaxID=459515 RepID=UPI000490F25C|nr:PspC domain-containing protein [Nakamurella lactea]